MKTKIIFIIILTFCFFMYGKSKSYNEENIFKLDTIGILTNKNLDSLILCLENAELKESKNVADIPIFIRETLNKLRFNNFSIANPEEDWQSTDVVFDKNLPDRQLIYLGVGENITLMAYYMGGFGITRRVLIIKHENEKITDFWCGRCTNPKSKEDIIEFIKNNKDKHWGLNTNMIYF